MALEIRDKYFIIVSQLLMDDLPLPAQFSFLDGTTDDNI